MATKFATLTNTNNDGDLSGAIDFSFITDGKEQGIVTLKDSLSVFVRSRDSLTMQLYHHNPSYHLR